MGRVLAHTAVLLLPCPRVSPWQGLQLSLPPPPAGIFECENVGARCWLSLFHALERAARLLSSLQAIWNISLSSSALWWGHTLPRRTAPPTHTASG